MSEEPNDDLSVFDDGVEEHDDCDGIVHEVRTVTEPEHSPAIAVTAEGQARREKEAKAAAQADRLLKQMLAWSTMRMFRERMIRSGRGEEYKRLWSSLRSMGHPPGTCGRMVREQMGYLGPKGEREELHREINHIRLSERDRKHAVGAKARKKLKRSMSFDEAVAELPQTAPIEIEMSWVGSHPAMYRFERQLAENPGVEPVPVLVTLRDVTDLNGKAPSRRAVITLQNWVNNPREFGRQMLGEQKKHAVKDANTDGRTNNAVVDDTTDIDAMLESIGG